MSHSLPIFTPGAGVLDLYPVALAHPCGMLCIFKQVLHFEISSRHDISRRLNISGSQIPQPSERKYGLRCIRLHSESQVCPRNCPLVSTHLLPTSHPPSILFTGAPGEMLRHCMPHTSLLGWSQTDVMMLWLISTTQDRSFKGATPHEHDLHYILGQRLLRSNIFSA